MSNFNLEHEKNFLSSVIRHPTVLAECPHINERDFSPTNRVVFSALKACLVSGTEFSKYLLIDRLTSLNIKIADTIEPAVYIESLDRLGVIEKAGIGIAKELKRTTVRRELNEIGKKIQRATEKDEGKKATDLVGEVTGIFNEHVNLIQGTRENEPVDMYGTIRSFLSRDNLVSDKAIASPFATLNDLYGFFDVGSCYLYCSRMKIGKSTWWLSMGQQLAAQDKDDKLRILVLDTELELWENHSRSLSQISGVNEFRIRQGWYRKRADEVVKVEAATDLLEPLRKRVFHCFCGGMNLENIVSVARRWAFKNLLEGKRGMIVYDYFKLNSSADFKSKNPLFIQIGEKMDAFKNLSKELQVPVLCFAQTNRENVDSKGGEKQQNSAVIGGSDMLAQFSANVMLLEELTPEERAQLKQLGTDGATHSLREIACRQRGPCESGEDKLVKVIDDRTKKERYMKNYILYRFQQFHVTEVGTLRSVMEQNRITSVNVQDGNDKPHLL